MCPILTKWCPIIFPEGFRDQGFNFSLSHRNVHITGLFVDPWGAHFMYLLDKNVMGCMENGLDKNPWAPWLISRFISGKSPGRIWFRALAPKKSMASMPLGGAWVHVIHGPQEPHGPLGPHGLPWAPMGPHGPRAHGSHWTPWDRAHGSAPGTRALR